MSRLFVLLSLFLLLFSVSRAYAQDVVDPNDPSRPDITGWTLMPGSSNISVNVSDNLMYYLGFDLTFQNPNDHSEHVRQVRVLTPFIVVKSNASLDKNYTDAAVAYATDGAEKALLKDYATKSDVILYIRWRVESDIQRGGVDKLVGENEVWFWDATGKWTYGRNLKIDKLMPSDFFEGFGDYPITVGVRYSLGKRVYNSTEVPYAFLFIALKVTEGGK